MNNEKDAPRASGGQKRFALGLDYGTESVRALLVDCATGDEAAQAVVPYTHGVMTERLPAWEPQRRLPPDYALQHPMDYIDSGATAVRQALRAAGPGEVIGVGVDFTSCTILPVRKDGTPLALEAEFREDPHAWVKLWKHHGAQREADEINALARKRGEKFLRYYGGAISSEWMLPKCLEVARKSPAVYAATDYFVDAGDWVVQQMTGVFTRSTCSAGYKGLWNAETGYPSRDFLRELDPAVEHIAQKWVPDLVAPGRKSGSVSASFAARSGLKAGTPVSAATIDAHSGVPGMGVYREGPLCIIMGTSSCHMALSSELKLFDGYAGVVKDGVIEGFHGYESGQSAVGDIFGWFVKDVLGEISFSVITTKAARLEPGESGLVALDWMNGNRSVLMDANLSGMVLGMTLATKPEEIYRALVEATAFGTRRIVDAYQAGGIRVTELVVCGGIAQCSFIVQTYADATGLPVRVASSQQTVALGAAIFGALAAGAQAGGFDSVEEAIVRMTRPPAMAVEPRNQYRETYDRLYGVYLRAHDFFGREEKGLMKELKNIKIKTKEIVHV
ncbi:MAG TPA: ribulokinase [Bdellovibrionota bacterium]|jgi:L-ribulokinase|nr:ribulokinase [Bdellovibrionota bacterium]